MHSHTEERGRVSGDGVELAYGLWPGNDSKADPLVAIHGLTASHVFFEGVAERLAGRWPIFAPDLRGRGESDKPLGPYGVEVHASDLAAAMRARGLGRSIVVGHSLGAYIASALAARFPELVKGLVLIDGGYTPEIPSGTDLQALEAALLAPILARLSQVHPSREAHRAFWRKQGLFVESEWSRWVEDYVAYGVGGEPPNLREKASAIGAKQDFTELTWSAVIRQRLEQIKVPALLLRATEGYLHGQQPLLGDGPAGELKRHLPQVEDRVVARTTHYTICMADPGATEVARAIGDFADRLSR